MPSYPIFITVDLALSETPFPVAIAWSLPNGQIKHTLISPDEEWNPWECDQLDSDISLLYERGATAREVIEEINMDHDQSIIFCFEEDLDISGLTQIYEAVGEELAFEIDAWFKVFSLDQTQGALDVFNWTLEQHGLNLHNAEDRVKAMLLTYAESISNL